MKRRVVILICSVIALGIGLIAVQSLLRPIVIESRPIQPTAQTTGVVKSLHAAPLLSSSRLQRAVVTLADGSEVEASVLPSCVVQSGDKVRVHVFANGPSQAVYVVAGTV